MADPEIRLGCLILSRFSGDHTITQAARTLCMHIWLRFPSQPLYAVGTLKTSHLCPETPHAAGLLAHSAGHPAQESTLHSSPPPSNPIDYLKDATAALTKIKNGYWSAGWVCRNHLAVCGCEGGCQGRARGQRLRRQRCAPPDSSVEALDPANHMTSLLHLPGAQRVLETSSSLT